MLCHEMSATGKAGAFSKFTPELSWFGVFLSAPLIVSNRCLESTVEIKNVTHLQRNQSMHRPTHTLSFRSHPYLQLAHLNHGISKPTLKAGNIRNSLTSKTITQEPKL
jgi:hypothetical protein